jgi:hypothetical protein
MKNIYSSNNKEFFVLFYSNINILRKINASGLSVFS